MHGIMAWMKSNMEVFGRGAGDMNGLRICFGLVVDSFLKHDVGSLS